MDQPKVGQLTTLEEQRDAIHFALTPWKAETKMHPAQEVYKNGQLLGIVDPFLKDPVYEGDVFWLFLMPNTITSLKHFWTHPVLDIIAPGKQEITYAPAESLKEDAEEWLKEYCDDNYITWEDFTRSLENHYDGEEYFTIHGSDAHGNLSDEFWYNVKKFTGKDLKKPEYFSCSC